MSEGFRWQRFGESMFTFTDDSSGVELRLRNVRADDGHVYADLFAYQLDEPGTWSKLLVRPRANLTSTRTIPDLAKSLNERLNRYDWRTLLESVCSILVEQMDERGVVTPLEEVHGEDLIQPELLKDIAPEDGLTGIVSNGGVGKSLIAMMIAIAVTTGETVGPFRPLQVGPVVYADWENDHRMHARRMTRLCMGLGIDVPRGRIIHFRANGPIGKCESELGELIVQNGAIATIADSIGFAAGGNLNASDVATQSMNALKRLPGSKLMLAHVRKDELEGERSSPTGSAFFWNGCHAVWALKATNPGVDGSLTLSLYQEKANLARVRTRPFGVSVSFEDPGGCITPTEVEIRGDMEAGSRMPLPSRIADVLKAQGRMTAEEIGAALGFTEKHDFDVLRHTLETLESRGNVFSWPGDAVGKRTGPRSFGWAAPGQAKPPAPGSGSGSDFVCMKCGKPAVAYTDQGIAVCDAHNLD